MLKVCSSLLYYKDNNMEPELADISDISDEIKEIILVKNSNFLNGSLLIIFFIFFSIFVYILYKDKQKHKQNYILRKLLFIKRNT